MAFPTDLPDHTTNENIIDGTTVYQASKHNPQNITLDALCAKVGVDSSAVTSSHDYKHANRCKADGSIVFNATLTAANTWQDLDLSAYVGANFAIVALEYTCSAAIIVFIKPKGYGSATVSDHANANYSGIEVYMDGAGNYTYVTSPTDASGVVQIAANNNTSTLTIKLVGSVRGY